MQTQTKTYALEMTHSPDDGGYYIAICNENGAELATTECHERKADAVAEAMRWCHEHAPLVRVLHIGDEW